MSLTALVFWLTYVGGLAAAIFNPVAGVALYILVYHISPETQWWGQSVNASGLRTSFTVALATAVGMVVRRPRMEHGARQFPFPFSLSLFLGVFALGSLVWGVDQSDVALYKAEKFVKILIFLFILIRCVRTPLHYQIAILSWLGGVLYIGYEAYGGVGEMEQGRLTSGLGGPDFAESSDLAVHLVATLPLIGAVFFMARSWWFRAGVLATGAFTVNTIIMTRTRNAVFGLVPMAISCVLALPKGYRLKGVAGVILGSILAVQLTDPGWWDRMSTIADYAGDSSAMGRLAYWKAAFVMAADHPFGIGLGNFPQVVMDYVPGLNVPRSAHNTLMTCLAELGWPGLTIFCAILILTIHRLGTVRATSRALPPMTEMRVLRWHPRFHLGWHATALRAALIGYLGCSMFTSRFLGEDMWLLLGLGACLYNVSKSMTAEAEPARITSEAVAEAAEPAGAVPQLQPGSG